MKKQVKIISIILIVITILASFSCVTFAKEKTTSVKTIIDNVGNPQYGETATIQDFGSRIVGVIQVVGIVIAVVVLMIVGIKYMMGSAEEKAEYKKVMVPYVIGAVLIFAATTIVNVVYQVSQNLIATKG